MSLTDKQALTLRQAVRDPGQHAGRRLGPSWGEGNDGYAADQEDLWAWIERAVTVACIEPLITELAGRVENRAWLVGEVRKLRAEVERWKAGDDTWRSLAFAYVNAEPGSHQCEQAWHEMSSAVQHWEAVERARDTAPAEAATTGGGL